MKTLVVVDMQKDFIDGSLGTKEAVAIVSNVAKKIEEYRKDGNQIIFTRDTHQKNALTTVRTITAARSPARNISIFASFFKKDVAESTSALLGCSPFLNDL